MRRPNILLLFTDQQRYDTICACGYPHMITPNLDRLAREGCVFSHAYTPNPVCVPARHNLLTGLPARYHGYTSNDSHPMDHTLPTLPQILSDHGYVTRAIGKMHFQPPREHHGFHRMELMEEIPKFREDDEYAMHLREVGLGGIQNIHGVRNLLYMTPQRSLIPEEHHGSTWVGDRSVAFLREAAGRRPFFLWAGWIAPHPPFDVPDSSADLYRGVALPDPLKSRTPLLPLAANSRQYADLPGGPGSPLLRRMRELYFSQISLVDRNVGRILKALEDTGELDNTLIVFTSDHGEMLGDYGCFQKMLPYDSNARIPFLVRYPVQFQPGTVRDEFVDLNDVLPTVLDAAGIPYYSTIELPGRSLLREEKLRQYQYMEIYPGKYRWVSLRDRRFKYNYYFGGGLEEMYDLQRDPGETTNLLAGESPDPGVREVRNSLRSALVSHERRWGLANDILGNDFIRFEPPRYAPGRNGQFPVFPKNITDPAERRAMNDFGGEVIAAVRNEPLVRLHELDLDAWVLNGAPPDLVERIRREGL